ncbi:MAG: AmmeMemoRadiSam system radical SAM enzyme [candidate division WOR-3 bacterium]|uniref:AmmeMemoRadiSam system radical SAM enzyme n=1 Tax=candidate division WOR-3 bacterium TaxID=2052148 RepID=A0A7C3IM32_UNCW3|nr:AmmeMemoRadiSam system radical SAM enzyme [candidate division WOR-3 bacterium]
MSGSGRHPVARYWQAEDGRIRCLLCPNRCLIAPGKTGRCLGRRNVEGRLIAENYGEVVSWAVDPVEKKPLYHFYPGAEIFSVATYGCNLLCPFCQNWEISQCRAPTRYIPPEELVRMVEDAGLRLVSYTYTEPLIWFEYLLDCGRLMHKAGIKNVLVTNGMIEPEPLEEVLPVVDAMNIDLKSIREEFYRDYVQGFLPAVLNTIRQARGRCHIELTTLLIPGRNDSEAELEALTDFVAGLGRNTVLHFSRYFPRHKARESVTPEKTLLQAAEIARKKLDYVYLGNVYLGPEFRDTFCPGCGTVLVDRSGYQGRVVNVENGKCRVCGRVAELIM